MTGTSGGQRYDGGLWWSGGTWTLRSVPGDGGALPESGAPWRRVPGWLLLPLAPVVGGAFVVALPVVGALLVAKAAAKAALAGGRRAGRDLVASAAAPVARPGEAHLTGDGPAPGAAEDLPPDEAAPNQGLDEVEAEVQARRPPPKEC
jgi:hypothetical protein